MASGRTVAVVGATGRQGGAVARHLLADGWRVRALSRRPESSAARELAARGADVVRADLGDRDSLIRAFDGVSGVFSVQNPMIDGLDAEVRHGNSVADAAKDARVGHVVYGSAGIGVAGTGVGSWESKLVVQAHMEALRLPLTVVRPMAFMELMTDKAFFPPVAMWYLMPKLMGSGRPVPWICVDDLGAVVARAFADPGRFIGEDIKVASEVLSIAECRAVWREVVGRPPRRFPMPVWMFERFVGPDLTTMWRWLRDGHFDIDPGVTHKIVPTVSTVREWLTRRFAGRRRAVAPASGL